MFEVSRKDILAIMPFKVLGKILVTPMFAKMIELRKQLGANLISAKSPWVRDKEQLDLLQDPTTSAAQNVRT